MAYQSKSPEPTEAPSSPKSQTPVAKKKREGVKMTDKQKTDLNKHMEKMKKGGMSLTEQRSHRMKMMGRMRKGMTLNKAHKDIMGK
jgi:hypothetical protein